MRVTVHVSTPDEIPAARAAAEAVMQDGDELDIIVAQRMPVAAERQAARPAGGVPANMGGA